MKQTTNDFGQLPVEMSSADLGDKRLNRRLSKITRAAVERPDAGFPQMMGGNAELEALYRFVNNDRVTPEGILEAHWQAAGARAAECTRILAIHDSTEFAFKRECPPDDMGFLKNGGRGFLGHFSLAVDPAREGLPLGVLAVDHINRTGPRKGKRSAAALRADPTRESLRWLGNAQLARERIPADVDIIHVADREADTFEFMAGLHDLADDFVIRIQHNRRVECTDGEVAKLFGELDGHRVRLRRDVELSRRGKRKTPSQKKHHPSRPARQASLEVTAGQVRLLRPASVKTEPSFLDVLAIHVHEIDPPSGEQGVDWKLLTSLPIATAEQVAFIVDCYRQRWIIEELFKALKTGCAFTKRQLDSIPALLNALAILTPVAWRLLLLRDIARVQPGLPATVVLTTDEITALRALGRCPLPQRPTLDDAMWAVAALGGHLRSNGPPGWQTIMRGLQDLTLLTRGWRAARREM